MKRSLVLAAVAGLALTSTGCGSSSSAGATAPVSPSSAATSSPAAASAAPSAAPSTPASASAHGASGPVGPGCPEAVGVSATEPVAIAASHTPMLTRLAAAVSGRLNPAVDLVDILDSGQFTVFAPVDAAFAKVPPTTLAKLTSDPALLTKVLTYHVLPMRVSPDKVVGRQKTVEGSTVTVTGTPGNLTVNGAKVLCGDVRTANATVYLIDRVLTPTSQGGASG